MIKAFSNALPVSLWGKHEKLKNLGKDVGGAIKDFKKSIRDDESSVKLNEQHSLEQKHQNNNDTTTSKN